MISQRGVGGVDETLALMDAYSLTKDDFDSIMELQVAIVLLAAAAFILGGHHRVYNQLLAAVHEDKRAAGYVDLTAERAFLVIAEEGTGAGAPPCDVKVNSVSFSGTYPRVFVRVQQAQ